MANPRSPQQFQLLLLVALLAVGGMLSKRMWSAPPAPPEAPAPEAAMPAPVAAQTPQQTAAATPSASPRDAAVYGAEKERDPFSTWLPKPAVSSATEAAQASPATEPESVSAAPPALVLQGIVWNAPKPKAIIDHHVVGVGETIQGYVVKSITKEGVLLAGAQQNWLLPRESGTARLQQ